jgi:hypothetical protein
LVIKLFLVTFWRVKNEKARPYHIDTSKPIDRYFAAIQAGQPKLHHQAGATAGDVSRVDWARLCE